MSTPNFALKNASRYFVFGMPVYYTQEDIDEYGLDQDLLGEYDELDTEANYEADKENVACDLEAKGWHDIAECDGDRSYPTTLFSEKTVSIMCGDTPVDITIKAGCTSGYYQAAIFDWFASVRVHSTIEGWYETFESVIDDLKNEAELAFSMYCDEEMYCTFRAFNGEAGYSKTGKRLWQEVEELNKKTA